ncbi:MAG: hypothetical protein ACXWP5_05605, partial [Bdellovibrionota bacterium]
DEEVRKLLGRGLERAIGLVRDYRPFVEECVGILMTSETIDEPELMRLWQRHHLPNSAPSAA